MSNNDIKYKLLIAHRVYPKLSKGAYLYNNKLHMVLDNIISLQKCINAIKTKIIIILNDCPQYEEKIRQVIFNENIDWVFINTPKISNHKTFKKQIEVIDNNKNEAEFVYFSEDDYLYKLTAIVSMIDALSSKNIDFVTPIDHPDRYSHRVPETTTTEVIVGNYNHWRQIGTTCCTFMTTSEVFNKAKQQLYSYGNGCWDGPMWMSITKDIIYKPKYSILALFSYIFKVKLLKKPDHIMKYLGLQTWLVHGPKLIKFQKFSLWGPIPSLAVHLCKSSLSPFCSKIIKENMNNWDQLNE